MLTPEVQKQFLQASKKGFRRGRCQTLKQRFGERWDESRHIQVNETTRTHTINEEQVGTKVLLLVTREIFDDSVDVLCCGHENIKSLELLGFPVAGNRFNDCIRRIRRPWMFFSI